jgi:long-chain fatty acid transport protein
MRKILVLTATLLAAATTAFAGGLLTNTNQSAHFVRMLSRNASTQIDAVYFNPAGLTKMEDGFHFAIHNQSIFQTKTVDSKFPFLNNGVYEGDVEAPVFPSAFAVFKKEDFAISLGFGPNAGGGSAFFQRGLPSFEIPISKVVPALSGLKALGYDVSGYNADLSFDGQSVFWGIQAGLTYNLSEQVSVYGGARFMPSGNTYAGSIENINLKVNGNFVKATEFLPQVGNGLKATATTLSNVATGLQPLITLGAGTLTLAQLQAGGIIDAATAAQLTGGLVQIGVTPAQVAAMSVAQIQGTYSNAATTLNTQGNTLVATGSLLTDKQVETEQTGMGITPIVGLNFSPSDNLNIALKYEHRTNLKLTNSTTVDDLGLFPDGQKVRNDIPSNVTIGIGYKPSRVIEAQLSYNLYYDKGIDWGNNVRELVYDRDVRRDIENNTWELGLGVQFNISDDFAVSAGGVTTNLGPADTYQSDFSFGLARNTAGFGIQWKITDQLTFDAGYMQSFFIDSEVSYNDPDLPGSSLNPYKETYKQKSQGFAFALSYSIFR